MVRRNENSVTLPCDSAIAGPVTWKMNDEDLDFDYFYEQKDQNLIVKEVDTPLLGEYSCWRGETKLSSTLLLQETEEGEDIGELHFFIQLNLTGLVTETMRHVVFCALFLDAVAFTLLVCYYRCFAHMPCSVL